MNYIFRVLRGASLKKLFTVIAPAYAGVNGGYTQVYKMGPRRGDGAEMAIVKLVAVASEASEETK